MLERVCAMASRCSHGLVTGWKNDPSVDVVGSGQRSRASMLRASVRRSGTLTQLAAQRE